jgi:hypothetical protein
MAKIFGSLVGTPLNTLQSSGFGAISNRYKDGHDQIMVRDVVVMQGNLIGDQVSLGKLRSNAYIDHGNSYLWWTAFGAGVTMNIGDVNHPATLGAAVALAAIGTADFEPAWAPAWMGQPLWQHLGYAADPGGTIELLGTFAGANPANGASLAWQIVGRNS